jgi:hypothetical protein
MPREKIIDIERGVAGETRDRSHVHMQVYMVPARWSTLLERRFSSRIYRRILSYYEKSRVDQGDIIS